MRGTTLIELMMTLGLIGSLVTVGVPRVVGLRDRLLVERHVARLEHAYRRARMAAALGQDRAILRASPDSLRVDLVTDGDTLAVWRAPGPEEDGVSLETTLSRVVFAPNGLTLGVANGRYLFRRGSVSRALVASRPGRLRIDR